MLVSSLHGLSVMTGKIGEPSEDYLEELSYVAFKEVSGPSLMLCFTGIHSPPG